MKYLLVLLFSGCCHLLLAQNPPISNQLDSFSFRQNGENITFWGVRAETNTDLNTLRLFPSMFPAVILPRPVAHQAIRIGQRQGIIADSLLKANQLRVEQEKLNALQISKMEQIIDLQKQRVELCESTNSMLNQSIQALNGQLNETRELAKASGKHRFGRDIWGLLLGAGIGLGLGVTLGVIAN